MALTIQLLLAAEKAKKARLLTLGKTAYRQDKDTGKQQGSSKEAKEKAKKSKTGAKQAQKKLKGAEHNSGRSNGGDNGRAHAGGVGKISLPGNAHACRATG
ncbi:hypothetical protein [Raoultella terrigena]|uniref:hypothetical protein n=1 Tax=Raoultella terrigena TaxID=577 RepID=UPI000F4B24C9|nr:hypothetical protein [Raoultella terrigena]